LWYEASFFRSAEGRVSVAVTVDRVHMKIRCQKGNFFVFVVVRERASITGRIPQPPTTPKAPGFVPDVPCDEPDRHAGP